MSTTSLQVIKARDILAMDLSQVWALGRGVHIVEFDDGERIKSYIGRTIISRYCWESLKRFPHIPLISAYHMKDSQLSNGTAKNILVRILEDIIGYTPSITKREIENIWGYDYDTINRIANDFDLELEEYVTSTCALDFVQILMHPEIRKANEWIQNKTMVTEQDIAEVHQKMLTTIKTCRTLRKNNFINAVKAGVLKYDQAVQLFGPIGNRADVDSRIFPKSIVYGYGHGLTTLYDSMLESRSASRALYFQKKPMADSEWGNRIVQLMSAVLQNVHDGDCGSTRYLPFTIADANHLSDAQGAVHLDESSGKLTFVKSTDRHLIGKTLQLRSALTCQHPDRYGICSTCYGMLSISLPERTNVGHTAVTIALGFLGQYILSTKHLDKTATAERLCLPIECEGYLRPGRKLDTAYIDEVMKGQRYYVSLDAEEVGYILDVQYVSNLAALRPERLSSITRIHFEQFYKGSLETYTVGLGVTTATPSLSMDFIRHLKNVGWELGEEGRYRVDMSEWDYTKPIITLPMVQFSSPAYMAKIQAFIKGHDKRGTMASVVDYEDMGAALQALNDLIGLKLRINIAHLAVILLSTKITSAETNDYRPPSPKWEGAPRKFSDLMSYRSLSAANAYQGHEKTAFNPKSFMCTLRPPHQLDWVVIPNARYNTML